MRRLLVLLAVAAVCGLTIAALGDDGDDVSEPTPTTSAGNELLDAFQAWAGDSGSPGHTDTSWQGPWLNRFESDGTVIVAILEPVGSEFDNPAQAQAEFAETVCNGMAQYLTQGPADTDGVTGIRVDNAEGQPLRTRSASDPACQEAPS